jgi:hypothetical protein
MPQTSIQLLQYDPANHGENRIFATTVGPQEGFTVAKIAGDDFCLFVRYPEAVFADKIRRCD